MLWVYRWLLSYSPEKGAERKEGMKEGKKK
jgi:hypothetical protein